MRIKEVLNIVRDEIGSFDLSFWPRCGGRIQRLALKDLPASGLRLRRSFSAFAGNARDAGRYSHPQGLGSGCG